MSGKGCTNDENLPLDTACLKVFNQNDDSVTLYSIVDECYLVSCLLIYNNKKNKNIKYYK